MSSPNTEFHGFVLRNCQEMRLPCLPDVTDPIVAIRYVAMAWCGVEGKNQVNELVTTAKERGLIACTIRRQPCIRLSDASKLVLAE